MTLALYFDHHVHAAITAGVRDRGIDVLTAAEDGADRNDDEMILQRTTSLNRVLFTQDDDFLGIAQNWWRDGREFAGIVYGHQLSITVGKAILDLELIAQVMAPEEMRNRIEYVPL